MATKLAIRNYSRSGNIVTFTLVALNADGSIDANFGAQVLFGMSNMSGMPAYTFVSSDQGSRTFTATITNPTSRSEIFALAGGDLGATLEIAGAGGGTYSSGTLGDSILVGGTGSDRFSSNDGDDLYLLQQGGSDTAMGGRGNDGFYFGGAYTAADTVNGGAGIYDTIGLQGNYSGEVTLGSILETELVVLLPGSDTRFGDAAGNVYDYVVTASASTIVSNNRLTVQANSLRVGEDFTFNGSATAIDFMIYGGLGVDNLTGGSGNDGFFFGQGRFGASDVVVGGAGTLDTLGLQGNYTNGGTGPLTFGAGQLSGIEIIALLSASDNRFGANGGNAAYNLTMNNANVAAGQTMIISATTLEAGETLDFFGAVESNGFFRIFSGAGADRLNGGQLADEIVGGGGNDKLKGNGGADRLTGGLGNDEFLYSFVEESLPDARDQILDFRTGDTIALDVLAGNTGNGSDFRFIGGSAQNGSRQVQVIQTGTAATVNVFIDADTVADFVINVTVIDGHSLTIDDFRGVSAQAAVAPLPDDMAAKMPFGRFADDHIGQLHAADLLPLAGSHDLVL